MKKGFTLAEVLITLGIIGIVAAMTLPVLVENYKKRQYVTHLKTAYSLLYQMSRLIMVDADTTNWADTLLITELRENVGIINNSNWSTQVKKDIYRDIVQKHLSKYLKIVEVSKCQGESCKASYLNVPSQISDSSNLFIFKMADGITMEFRFFTDDTSKNLGYVNVDVNGAKKPNQWGRDVFQFYFWSDGSILPCGAQVMANKTNNNQNYWATPNSYAWSNCSLERGSYGQGCTGRVLEDDAMLY